MESDKVYENDLNLKATELRLGLPGTHESEQQAVCVRGNKRPLPDQNEDCGVQRKSDDDHEIAPPAK